MKTFAHISITHPLLMQNEEYKAMAERHYFLEGVQRIPIYSYHRHAQHFLNVFGLEKYEDVFEILCEKMEDWSTEEEYKKYKEQPHTGWSLRINGVWHIVKPKQYILDKVKEFREEYKELEDKRIALKKKLVEELGGIKAFDAYDKQRKKD